MLIHAHPHAHPYKFENFPIYSQSFSDLTLFIIYKCYLRLDFDINFALDIFCEAKSMIIHFKLIKTRPKVFFYCTVIHENSIFGERKIPDLSVASYFQTCMGFVIFSIWNGTHCSFNEKNIELQKWMTMWMSVVLNTTKTLHVPAFVVEKKSLALRQSETPDCGSVTLKCPFPPLSMLVSKVRNFVLFRPVNNIGEEGSEVRCV